MRHNISEVLYTCSDLTTSLINDSYRLIQIISNPQYQQRRINEVKAVTSTVVGFALTLWAIWQEVADRIVTSAFIEPDLESNSITTQQVIRAITHTFIADIHVGIASTLSTLMPAVAIADSNNTTITTMSGSLHIIEINA